jgi:hypothetical protein
VYLRILHETTGTAVDLLGRQFDHPSTYSPSTVPVDYGEVYPRNYGFRRHSMTKKPTLYGTLPRGWVWSSDNPVHFICHSQGGTTIRLLIELMSGRHGNLHSQYFSTSGHQNRQHSQKWVRSVITVGTPHKGTTITDFIHVGLPTSTWIPNEPPLC